MPGARAAADIALSLAGAVEAEHFGSRSFRVGGKIFAQVGTAPDRVLVKMTAADQERCVHAWPDAYHPDPSWGRHGWTSVTLGRITPKELTALLQGSYDLVAAGRGRRGRR